MHRSVTYSRPEFIDMVIISTNNAFTRSVSVEKKRRFSLFNFEFTAVRLLKLITEVEQTDSECSVLIHGCIAWFLSVVFDHLCRGDT